MKKYFFKIYSLQSWFLKYSLETFGALWDIARWLDVNQQLLLVSILCVKHWLSMGNTQLDNPKSHSLVTQHWKEEGIYIKA